MVLILNVKNVRRPRLSTVKQYNDAAKANQSKLIEAMEKIQIKEVEASPLLLKRGGSLTSKGKKPKTFKL